MVISKPSAVSLLAGVMAPALLTRMSTSASRRSENDRTDERSARSSSITSVDPPISAARCAPSPVLRTARITCAPARVRICAVPSPTPLVAPVTMMRLPVKLPSRVGDHAALTRRD